jgi:uncharacterized protein
MKTLILGATPNPDRYAYRAAISLQNNGHEIVLVGIKQGEVNGVTIQNGMPDVKDIHTVTLYVGPKNQPQYYNYILSLKPKRVIFNPGTENSELENLLKQNYIEPIIACTLVMLSVGNY